MTTTGDDAISYAAMQFWIAFDVMFRKGLISFEDIHESISRFRELIPLDDPRYAFFKVHTDIMERTYQAGPYTPLPGLGGGPWKG